MPKANKVAPEEVPSARSDITPTRAAFDLTPSREMDTGRADGSDSGSVEKVIAGKDEGYINMSKYMFHPNQPERKVFDLLFVVIIIYTCATIPFRVCFDVQTSGAVYYIELCLDLMFVIDIVLNFRTAVVIDDKWVGDPWTIARHQFSGPFWISLISIIPFDLIVRLMDGDNQFDPNYVRLPKFLRMFRLYKLVKLVNWLRDTKQYRHFEASFSDSTFKLTVLGFTYAACTHLCACFYHFCALAQPQGTVTWVIAHGLANSTIFERYVASAYWALWVLCNLGTGPAGAFNTTEMWYTVFVSLVGVLLFSYTAGTLMFMIFRSSKNATRERIDEVNAYMKFRRFPQPLRVAVRENYLYSYAKQQAATEGRRMISELTGSLKEECGAYLVDAILKNCPVFEGASPEFVSDIIMHLYPIVAQPGDSIIVQGEIGEEMYIIQKGKVEVYNEITGMVYVELLAGQYFGEIAILNQESPVRMASVRAMTYCEFDVLRKEDFLTVLYVHGLEVTDLEFMRATIDKRLKEVEDMERALESTFTTVKEEDSGDVGGDPAEDSLTPVSESIPTSSVAGNAAFGSTVNSRHNRTFMSDVREETRSALGLSSTVASGGEPVGELQSTYQSLDSVTSSNSRHSNTNTPTDAPSRSPTRLAKTAPGDTPNSRFADEDSVSPISSEMSQSQRHTMARSHSDHTMNPVAAVSKYDKARSRGSAKFLEGSTPQSARSARERGHSRSRSNGGGPVSVADFYHGSNNNSNTYLAMPNSGSSAALSLNAEELAVSDNIVKNVYSMMEYLIALEEEVATLRKDVSAQYTQSSSIIGALDRLSQQLSISAITNSPATSARATDTPRSRKSSVDSVVAGVSLTPPGSSAGGAVGIPGVVGMSTETLIGGFDTSSLTPPRSTRLSSSGGSDRSPRSSSPAAAEEESWSNVNT